MVTVKGGLLTSLGSALRVENFDGSDCTGVNGANNRTVDITRLATNELIFIAGAFLYPTNDYTSASVGGVTRYTFLNKVYQQFKIRILYWV